MTISVEEKNKKVERIKLTFHNPLIDKVDSVLIRKQDLETLREREKSGLVIVSFFHSMRDQSYIINLHVDRDNNVRSCNQSTFFLKSNMKLFPTFGTE
ncbi:MAG: hypothetical protein EU548_05110 [Promethearchaeota archaeon]|nr:MAG: hypothetical protein EU548_05110 [Candidatus Lokiarchaeota archaeon]